MLQNQNTQEISQAKSIKDMEKDNAIKAVQELAKFCQQRNEATANIHRLNDNSFMVHIQSATECANRALKLAKKLPNNNKHFNNPINWTLDIRDSVSDIRNGEPMEINEELAHDKQSNIQPNNIGILQQKADTIKLQDACTALKELLNKLNQLV